MIGKELNDPTILQENVYNMDETGVLLSVLSSLKEIVAINYGLNESSLLSFTESLERQKNNV